MYYPNVMRIFPSVANKSMAEVWASLLLSLGYVIIQRSNNFFFTKAKLKVK